jgi:hypothetical protein
MKLSPLNIVVTLFAFMVASASAEDTIAQNHIAVAIISLLQLEDPATPQVLNAIDAGMNAIGTNLTSTLNEVVAENSAPPAPLTRNLRGERNLQCAPCTSYPPQYTRCWARINGVWDYYNRCRRQMTEHEDLSEEALAELSEKDRHRHLQISTICNTAKDAFASTIVEAEGEGVIPLPEGAKIVEKCLVEIIE